MEEITATLRQGKFPNPTQAAAASVEEVHRPQLEASAVTVRTKSRLMRSLAKQLLVVMEDIAAWLRACLPNGVMIAHAMRMKTSSRNSASTAPVPFQSGNYARAHKRFACVKPWRNDLYQFARATTLSEPWAAAYYQRKLAEGKTHSMALRALANIWVRIMYRMWVNETCYQAQTFEAAQLAHAKRSA